MARTNIADGERWSGQRGFTLLELLVVIWIIAGLGAVVYPAVQSQREQVNLDAALEVARQLHDCATAFEQAHGHRPSTLAELLEFCRDPVRLSGDAAHGFLFAIDSSTSDGSASWVVTGNPACPGVTGSNSILIDRTGALTIAPAPGAAEGRQQMFDGLLVAAANAVAELLALDPDAASHARDPALDPETIGLVFDSLDANHDGLLTAVEAMLTPPDPVLVNDPVLLEIYESFRVPAVQAVKLGAGNEDVASFPGVALADLPRDPVPFFGFETLRRLSLLFVSGEEVAGSAEEGIIKSLWAKLAAAERAESEGDLGAKEGALDAFVAEVDALAGRKLTHDAAATLAALAKAL